MALPAFSLAGFLLSSCNKQEPKPVSKSKKIGIIGAGIAGLQAAKLLYEQGFEVEILEAGDRIGGRIHSDDYTFGLYNTELGASTAIGSNNAWYQMVYKHAGPLKSSSDQETTYFLNGNSIKGSDSTEDMELNQMKSKLAAMGNYNGSDASVQDYIENSGVPEKVRFIFNTIAEDYSGTSTDRASVLLNSNENAHKIGSEKYLPGSFSFKKVLMSEYASVLPFVLTNTPVKSINYSGTGVEVTDVLQKQRTYDRILVTVPLSILKLKWSQPHAIQFVPELPQYKLDAMNNLGMDSSVRIILKLKKRLWEEGSKLFYTEGNIRKFEVLKEDTVNNVFIVAATVHGDVAEQNLDMKSDVEILNMIRSDWNAYMGSNAGNYISEAKMKHWGKDPFIQGGFSYHKTGGSADSRELLAKPINNLVYFAGEACNTSGKSGSISGAIETGTTSANQIIRQFA